VGRITDLIGSQKAYATAYLLPEFWVKMVNFNLDMISRDTLFREAAEILL
jgi:S-DNA-T family DNA segregation ATPase FtsK/SpoIIIE